MLSKDKICIIRGSVLPFLNKGLGLANIQVPLKIIFFNYLICFYFSIKSFIVKWSIKKKKNK